MIQAKINYMKNDINDEIYTPEYAIKPMLKYIPKNVKTIWCPCDTKESNICKILDECGYNVLYTHIELGFDFLNDTPTSEIHDVDMIITNPPYSNKDEFIKKCYDYNKPFMLLLPLTALEGVARNKMFNTHGISVIVLDRRINFLNQKKNNYFNSSWFYYEKNKQNKIYFETLKKEGNKNE